MSTNPVLENIRKSLGRKPGMPLAERPPVLQPRIPGNRTEEIGLFLGEIRKLSGNAQLLDKGKINGALAQLIKEQEVKKACVWLTPRLAAIRIEARLTELGVEIVSPHSDKKILAECDLGITEADFALPETGTVGLLSDASKSRAVSLLPRVHLAVVDPDVLCVDLHQVFEKAKHNNYLIFITGPSRTADIELTVTLGVHGPKSLYVWMIED